MEHRDDPFALWVFSGIIGVLVRNAYSYLAKQIGLANFYIWNVGASLLIDVPDIQTAWGTVLGFLVDFSVAGLFGIILGLIFEWRGQQHYLFKGLSIGIAAWMFFYGILYHNLPHTKDFAPSDPLSNISAFIGHSIFGITMAFVYVKYFSRKFASAAEKNTAVNNPPDPQVVIIEVNHRSPSPWQRLINGFVKPKSKI